MTQATQAPAPPVSAAPPPAPALPATTARPAVSQTPRRLRLLSLGLIVAGVLFGVFGGAVLALQAQALGRADDNAAQLVRVQQIQTDLLSADATATNSFLVGGLEPTAQRESYDRLIADASRLIAEAARAQPADEAALAALNTEVVSYSTTIELARANNRQGFPIGAQYLRTASSGLRTTALPILDTLVKVNAERAADEMDSRAGWWFALVGVLVLAGFVLTMVWLARTFRRTLNVGVLIGAVVLLAVLVGVAIGLGRIGSALNQLENGTFTQLTAAAQARIRANDAKSNESLTLISRGSGAAFEQAWKDSAAQVENNLGTVGDEDLKTRWADYTAVHGKIRSLDDGGSWDQAVALATGTGAGSANATFSAFDTGATAAVDQLSTALADGVRTPRGQLVFAALLTLLAGIGAALLGRWGLAARLREYR
jgi:hypothetical protein